MYCIKCGSPMGQGEQFCSVCGEKAESAEQPVAQQPVVSAGQPGYGPYSQPQYGQPIPPPKKKSPLILALIGVAAVLAIAAVVIFVVLPGGQSAFGPLSGNTPQTMFVNDSAAFFKDAFQGLGSDTFERIAKEPFDLDYEMTVEVEGQPAAVSINAAYDEKTLGFSADTMGVKITMLLLEDTMYQSMGGLLGGSVYGTKFNTDADLSKPMSLEKRIAALTEGLNVEESITEEQVLKLVEMFFNSIDEKCFEKTADKWTLTMGAVDVKNMLTTFKGKLEQEKELMEDLEDFLEKATNMTVDIPKALGDAVRTIESSAADFSIVWVVEYEDGKPAGLNISVGDDMTKAGVSFASEKTAAGAKIDFDVAVNGAAVADGSISYVKAPDGIEYSLTINSNGQTVTISGSEKWNNNKTTGKMTISVPQGEPVNIDYEGTLKFGMPNESVDKDKRFEVDTEGATITDFSSGMGGIPGLNMFGAPAPELIP